MKQKTAIRQLIEYLQSTRDQLPPPLHTAYSQGRDFALMHAIEKAKELESVNEQQIKDAYASVNVYVLVEAGSKFQTIEALKEEANKYFNETFEKL